jgi:transcriptional regulator of acetoin/glycerol metabolism
MRYACAISDGPLLMPQSFPPDLFSAASSGLMRGAVQPALPVLAAPADVPPPALKPKDLALRERMLETLRRNQWQVTVSARELGLSRATFYRKLAKLQIVAPNRQAW